MDKCSLGYGGYRPPLSNNNFIANIRVNLKQITPTDLPTYVAVAYSLTSALALMLTFTSPLTAGEQADNQVPLA